METGEDKFFAELANYRKSNPRSGGDTDDAADAADTAATDVNDEPEAEASPAAAEEMQDSPVEATFAKASTATASRRSQKESDLSLATEGSLTIDVYQTPSDIVVESAIAGVGPEDIDIEVSTDSVTVRGERHKQHSVGDDDYYYQECYWGRFSRSVILPQEIDPEAATVNFKNGILTIKLPKLNRKKSRKLKVRMD